MSEMLFTSMYWVIIHCEIEIGQKGFTYFGPAVVEFPSDAFLLVDVFFFPSDGH